MNYGYSPTFPAPTPHYFRLPQTRPMAPLLLPQATPTVTVMGVANPALQFSTQQLEQQPITPISPTATATTTTTTTTTTDNIKPSENPFPDKVTSVQPVTPADGKVPNKTFEVLEEIKPPPAFPLPIPTAVIAIDSRSNPVFKFQSPKPSSDAVKTQAVPKLSASPRSGDDDDALKLVSERQGLLVNEIRVYSDPPIVRWMFLISGIVLIVLGILTALWCRPSDQFYYCRIWGGVALVAFAIIGYIHGEDYITRWKNIAFTIFGLVTSAMTLACLFYVMRIICHRVIEIFQFSSWSDYLDEVRWRMAYLNDYPSKNLSSSGQPFPSDNEIACLSMDGVSFVVDCSSFVIIISTTLVVNKFYNSLHVITFKVRPFDKPKFFNPYGQVLVGEVQIFFGFLLQCVIYGNQNITWQSILAPAFSGVVPIIAGIVAALTLKSCGINSRLWNFLSVILELVSLIITALAIVLITVGLVENVRTFSSTVMTQTTFSRNLMIFSVFAFSVADLVCLISFCYSAAVLIRLLVCICYPERHPKEADDDMVGGSGYYDWSKYDGKYREVKKLLLNLSTD